MESSPAPGSAWHSRGSPDLTCSTLVAVSPTSVAGNGYGEGHVSQEVSHFRGIGGFNQVPVKPRFQATLAVFLETEGGDGHQPHLVLKHRPQLPGNRIPVQPRHGEVQQHDIRWLR